MMSRFSVKLAALAFALAPLTSAFTADAATAQTTDWTRTVALTPSGSFLLGNPNAKTKLVEYMSYSCPHCADFAKEAAPELKARIRTGQFSLEYRNFIRDGFDLTAALLARCGGVARFLANHEAIFSSYETWIDQAEKYSQSQADTPQKSDRTAQLIDIGDKVGLTSIAMKNGITQAAANQCLGDQKAVATVLALTAGAWDIDPNFEGTPTFLLNGKVLRGVHNWQGLKPQLPPLPTSAK